MKIEIKSIWGTLLFEGDFSSIAEAVTAAVKHGANLESANLYGANLESANLYGANLYGANLESANLESANLYGANLYGANLKSANLYGANLYGANLYGANLYGANLESANLESANLESANLKSANLKSANLYGAKMTGLQKAQLLIVPPEGDVIGWKKCSGGVIAKLLIPDGVVRHNATGRKCRAEYAKVLALYLDGKKFKGPAITNVHGPQTVYTVGEEVHPNAFEKDRFNECAPGIHFFITREEAEAY